MPNSISVPASENHKLCHVDPTVILQKPKYRQERIWQQCILGITRFQIFCLNRKHEAMFYLCCAVLTHSIMSDSLWHHGLQLTRLLCPGDSPDKNTGVGCHILLQGIFPTQGPNPYDLCLLHCWQVLQCLATWEAPYLCSEALFPSWEYCDIK